MGQFKVEGTPRIKVRLLELLVRPEIQAAPLDETLEPGIQLVGLRVKTAGEDVLRVVVWQFLPIRQVAVTGIKALRQEEQPADPVAVPLEVGGMIELVRVPVGMVRPDVLNLVTVRPAGPDVIGEMGVMVRGALDVVGHPGEHHVDDPPVLLVHGEAGIGAVVVAVLDEVLRLFHQFGVELGGEFVDPQPPDFPHHQKHRVLHGRVGDEAEVPETPRQQDVEEPRHQPDLAGDDRFRIARAKRGQKKHVLEGETVEAVVEDGLQPRDELLRRFDAAQVGAAVEVEVSLHELVEGLVGRESDGAACIPHPTVELGADTLEVFRLGVALPFADLLSVLAPQPRLEAIGLDFLACVIELPDPVAPEVIDRDATTLVHVGQQVALEHVGGAEREAPVVHGLEDRVGVVVRVCGDLDDMDVLREPVDEVGKRLLCQFGGKILLDVLVAGEEVLDGFRLVRWVEGLDLVPVDGLHAGQTIGHVDIEGDFSKRLGKDALVDVDLDIVALLEVAQVHQQQCQAGEPLLAIDDVVGALLLADDDGAEEVVRIILHLLPLVTGLVVLEELPAQVVKQLLDLLGLPLVLPLVVIDGVLHSLQEFADGLGFAEDFSHAVAPFVISSSSPSVSSSSARMSALISARVLSLGGS